MITIVDYGLGNLGSVANMLRRIGVRSRLTTSVADVLDAEALILPGVGHFGMGMDNLRQRGLIEALDQRVRVEKTPVLGICLGAQLLARHSEEGDARGLGWIAADVKRFDFKNTTALPVPHMGWNEVEPVDPEMFAGHVAGDTRFYFVHSFHFVCDAESSATAWCNYGYRFAAAVRDGHVWGAQFHPEKSHRFGMRVLQNWVDFTNSRGRRAA